jgi:hypothetical protein
MLQCLDDLSEAFPATVWMISRGVTGVVIEKESGTIISSGFPRTSIVTLVPNEVCTRQDWRTRNLQRLRSSWMSRAKILSYLTSTTPLPTYPTQHNLNLTTTINAFAMPLVETLQSALAAAGHGCQIGVGRHSG